MVKHYVMLEIGATEGKTKEENILAVLNALRSLEGKIPGLLAIEAELNAKVDAKSNEIDVMLVTEFPDFAALERYQAHPEHVKVLDFIKTVLVSRWAVDYEVRG